MRRIVSIILSILTFFSTIYFNNFTGDYEYNKQIPNKYPFVFDGGFLVYGTSSGVRDFFPPWGIGSCDLLKELNDLGYDCREASTGPYSSAWDRSCELYAQLTGTTVDYGEAHAKEHNHDRYGRTYNEPLVENWGQTNEDGSVNKINVIGQSFGGTTIIYFLTILSDGDEDEMAATTDGSISPFFEGGKSQWVNSITTIASPNNGTTTVDLAKKLGICDVTEFGLLYLAGGLERLGIDNFIDFQLEHFGLGTEITERTDKFLNKQIHNIIKTYNDDSAIYDLSIEGAKKINEKGTVHENVYYYTMPYCATVADEKGNQVIDNENIFFLLKWIGNGMGKKKNNDIFGYGDEWLENDGLINTISEKNPFNQPYIDFDFGMTPQPGIWNIFPVSHDNHGSMIGMGNSKQNVLDLFTQLLDMINSNG